MAEPKNTNRTEVEILRDLIRVQEELITGLERQIENWRELLRLANQGKIDA